MSEDNGKDEARVLLAIVMKDGHLGVQSKLTLEQNMDALLDALNLIWIAGKQHAQQKAVSTGYRHNLSKFLKRGK